MTYNDDAPGDNTPPQQQESKLHIGSKVALIGDEGSLGMIRERAPIRGVWVVRWYAGKQAGKEMLAHEDTLRSA